MKHLILTAGHQLNKAGAMGFLDEAKETIKVRDELKKALEKCGVCVTSDNDTQTLNDVVKMVNAYYTKNKNSGEIYCIDIHFNASSNPTANGCECVVAGLGSRSIELAKKLCDVTELTLKIKNRGVKEDVRGLAMLQKTKSPSIIFEICFVSNETDAKNYKNNFDALISAISDTILGF